MISHISALLAAVQIAHSAGAAEEAHFDLWKNVGERVPEARGGTVTAYLPDPARAAGAAAVVVPGGSFIIRCEDQEGAQVGNWLRSRGIAAFVVHYRLIPTHTMREELSDVQRAIQLVRSRAADFGVSKKRIGIIGFSAGSYLGFASSVNEALVRDDSPISREASRPDFLVMVYGAPSKNFSSKLPQGSPAKSMERFFREQVGDGEWRRMWSRSERELRSIPPTFMFATAEDRGHAESMTEMYARLLRAEISTEAHFFARGPHGVGLAFGDPTLGAWPILMENWLRAEGFLSDEKRVAVHGTVSVDGKPLELGQVIFRPMKNSRLASRTAYLFNLNPVPGEFVLEEKDGLAPGKYEVELQQTALWWKSTRNDPLILKLRERMATDNLTAEDLTAWKKWSSDRERGPTLPEPRMFRSVRPGGEPLVVEIESGKSLNLEFFTR